MDRAGWALLITAAMSGLTGVATAVASIMSARAKGEQECQDRLKVAWKESEAYAEELHRLKMGNPGFDDDAA